MAKKKNERAEALRKLELIAKRGRAAGDKPPTPYLLEPLAQFDPFAEQTRRLEESAARLFAPAPPPPNSSVAPVPKSGKEWISDRFERRRGELLALTITEAGSELAEESQTAPDCRKPLSAGYCTNELRKLKAWKPKPRNSPKQGPK